MFLKTEVCFGGTKDQWKKSWQKPLLKLLVTILLLIFFYLKTKDSVLGALGYTVLALFVCRFYMKFSENYWCGQTFGIRNYEKPNSFLKEVY